MDCVCPRPAALKTVNRVVCPENLGQIQRLIFQRVGNNFDEATPAGALSDIKEIGSWTPLIAAADSTKIVMTPYLDNCIIPQAEKITRGGGDNTTLNGVEQVLGFSGITCTADLTSVPVFIIEQIRDLMCDYELGIYAVNQYGRIVCRQVTPAPPVAGTVFTAIPIEPQTLAVPFPGNNGFATLDAATMSWGFAEDWAKSRAIVTPGFNIKTALLPPVYA